MKSQWIFPSSFLKVMLKA